MSNSTVRRISRHGHGLRPTGVGPGATLLVLLLSAVGGSPVRAQDEAPLTPAGVLASAPESAWRELDPENTVYLILETGNRVVLELAPAFAPRHVANIRAMVRAGLFDGGGVVRSQDNYVVQWGPDAGLRDEDIPADIARQIPGEFTVSLAGLPFTPVPGPDAYAPEVGYSGGFPMARDPAEGTAWMVHCYGVVGVARSNSPDSGNGSSLYAVNGHAPRHLDRNLSMAGRIISGMEHLSTLPRGTEELGFYATREEETRFTRVLMGTEMAATERARLQVMRTDSPAFRDWIEARRSRTGEWWVYAGGGADVCNVGVPTRPR